MSDRPDELGSIRERIDAIDERIHELIADRARLAQGVGEAKRGAGTVEFYRPEREADMISRKSRTISSSVSGPWLRATTWRSTSASRSGR